MSKTRKTQSIAIPRAKMAQDDDLPSPAVPKSQQNVTTSTTDAVPTKTLPFKDRIEYQTPGISAKQPKAPSPVADSKKDQPAPQPGGAKLQEDDEYGDYGDDFEDYEEDFEDFEAQEFAQSPPVNTAGMAGVAQEEVAQAKDIMDVRKALDAENERASSRQSQRNKEIEVQQPKHERVGSALPQRQFIDLDVAHKQSQKAKALSQAEQRMMKRAKDLQNLIELDVVMYDILDLPPLNEYELYIRNYGTSNTVQASTQSNEDLLDRDLQTDDWLVEDKWSQAPADMSAEVGSSLPDLPWMGIQKKPKSGQWREAVGAKQTKRSNAGWANVNVDAVRLIHYLRKSSQVMDVLLEENARDTGVSGIFQPTATVSISQGVSELGMPTILPNRSLRELWYSPTDYRLVMAAFSSANAPMAAVTSPLDNKGIICLWRLSDPSVPYIILMCESPPTTCAFSPTKSSLVFAGTADGTLQAWDLTEPASLHPIFDIDGKEVRVRRPSYSTDGLYITERVHEESIISIMTLYEGDTALKKDLGEGEGEPFQIASLDASGKLQMWAVVELRSEVNDSADVDYGMGIGSKIKLVKNTHLQLRNPERHATVRDLQVQCGVTSPDGCSTFLVGLTTPQILHESRFHSRVQPRYFQPTTPTPTPITDPVTSICYCPQDARIFIAGHESGRLALYVSTSQEAVRIWELEAPVRICRWSMHRAGVFYVLDALGKIHVWDLVESATGPSRVVQAGTAQTGKVVHFALSTAALTGGGKGRKKLTTASQLNLAAGSTRNATLVVAYERGKIEVHLLEQELAEMGIDEEDVFEDLLG